MTELNIEELLNLNDHGLVLTTSIYTKIVGIFLLIDERLIILLRLSSSLQLNLNETKRECKSMASIRAGIIKWPGERIPSSDIMNR